MQKAPPGSCEVFSSRLRALMHERDLPKKKLDEWSEMYRKTVMWSIARGSVPAATDLAEIARLFGTTVDYLLGLTDVSTLNADVRSVSDITRLHEKTINELLSMSAPALDMVEEMIHAACAVADRWYNGWPFDNGEL